MMVHGTVLLLTVLGFLLLALTHTRGSLQHRLSLFWLKGLFWLGWLLLSVALTVAIGFWGSAQGATLWAGYLSAGAGLVFLCRVVTNRYG